MIFVLKKINLIFKKKNVNLIIIAKYFSFIFKSLKNYLKILFNNSLDSFYIPNLAIKNTIYINPSKIRYINTIPIKFNKSTKLISDFDKSNKNLDTFKHQTYVTCHQLFIEGKKIEQCDNYYFFKKRIENKIKDKDFKNHNDLIEYFKKKKELFENIKKRGVKTHSLFNIQFIIDKNCNLVKINSGNHRFFISRILKLKLIPVEIKLIHSNCFVKNKNKKINIRNLNNFIKNVEDNYR